MLVAIHQPNFLPWLGWFDKLARADRLVLLDNVAVQMTGSSWVNRVQILIQGRAAWLTMPLDRSAEKRARIDTAEISDGGVWRRKARRTLEQAYARTPGFEQVMPMLVQLLERETNRICEFNLAALEKMSELLGLDRGRMVRASTLPVRGVATDLLINIVRTVGGTGYLSGGGAGSYQDESKFAQAGIELVYQSFSQRSYPQRGAKVFVPGLSAVDALMQLGPAGATRLLAVGRDDAMAH